MVSIGDLGPVLHRSDLGRPPTLSVPLEVNEPATVTIQILRRDNVVQEATVTQSSAGAFEGTISLRHVHGNFTLRVVAVDPEGAMSAPVAVTFHVRR